MKKAMILFIGVFLISSCAQTKKLNTKEVLLRFNPQNGDSYTMKMALDMDMGMTETGKPEKRFMKMLMNFDSDISISDKNKDGSFYLNTVMNRINITIEAQGNKMVYDSENVDTTSEIQKIMHSIYSKLLDVDLKSKLSDRGRVLIPVNYQKLLKDMPSMKEQIDQMNNIFNNSFVEFPEKPVKVGDSWTSVIDIEGKVAMRINLKYKVKKIKLETVDFDISGDIELYTEMQDKPGSISGFMEIDRKTGFTKNFNMTQNFTMKAKQFQFSTVSLTTTTMEKK